MEATQLELTPNNPPKSTRAMVAHLRDTGQDWEWYPTTDEILSIIKDDIDSMIENRDLSEHFSLLDCGAGDGRSLMYLTKGRKLAIEKSRPLITAMDKSIYVIGAEFHQQQLLDKECNVTFSNPPYMEYAEWSEKIIRESRSGLIYLVIPERWKSNKLIQDALELRNAEAEVIGSTDFLNAERQARAKVDIVKINLRGKHHYYRDCESSTDPFELWFDEHFKIEPSRTREYEYDPGQTVDKEAVQNELVQGSDIVTVLTSLYDRDLQKLISNYKAFETLDPALLDELGVSFEGVRAGLKTKISGLKNVYWKELFDNLTKITDKLTSGSREAMLNKLTERTDVDFNTDNVYAVVIWVIKNANHYFDQQLVNLVEQMVEKANVILYKSNKKTFGDEQWRYCRKPDELDRFKLDYRVVLERSGGLCTSDFSFERDRYNGLSARAYTMILDILTVATNLGFDTTNRTRPTDFQWESNKGKDFYYYDRAEQKEGLLMTVKAFKNGNLHLKLNKKAIVKLNVEFGRLKGWVKSAQEAAEEMDITTEEAAESFKANLQLTGSNILQLGFNQAA